MHRSILPVFSAVALAAASFTPVAAQAATQTTGTIAIPLTDAEGELTETALEGFDVADTTSPISTLAASFASIVKDATTPGTSLASKRFVTASDVQDSLHEDYMLLTEPIDITSPFAVVGVTWNKDEALPLGSNVELRTLDGGTWSNWYSLDIAEAPEGVEAARNGTEHSISGSSTGIQVRITRGAGDLPSDLQVDIVFSEGDTTLLTETDPAEVLPSAQSLEEAAVDGSPEDGIAPDGFVSDELSSDDLAASDGATDGGADEDAATAQLASVTKPADAELASTANSNSTLKAATGSSLVNTKANIRSRASWLGSTAAPSWSPSYAPFEGVIIHHTAGSNTYTQAQVASVVRGIYTYHAFTNGWGDIGYNVLIDKFGGRWEGRYGTLSSPSKQMVVGGHARPRNTGTMGVSVMATYYSTGDPNGNYLALSETVLTAIEEVSAWKFIVAGVNPNSTSPLTIPSETSTYTSSIGKPLPRIVGHKDVAATACPGYIYDRLSRIRTNVAKLYSSRSNPWEEEIMKVVESTENTTKTAMFRLYNRISHEHLYTASANEAITLTWGDWTYEGVGWVSPEKSTKPVYRLYNPVLCDHHYTTDKNEVDTLVARYGWRYEGIGWYAATGSGTVAVYRQFNSGLTVGSHNFTTDLNEYNTNNSKNGWKGEGVAWRALSKGWQAGS